MHETEICCQFSFESVEGLDKLSDRETTVTAGWRGGMVDSPAIVAGVGSFPRIAGLGPNGEQQREGVRKARGKNI